MLSENLQDLAEVFAGCIAQDTPLVRADMVNLVACLNALSAEAAHLEGHVVPEAARRDPCRFGGNVVSLDHARRQREITKLAERST